MKVLDLNLLLYAVNTDSERHAAAQRWLTRTLGSGEDVGIPWAVVLGFLRLATNKHVFKRPLALTEAATLIDGWLALAGVHAIAPGDGHWEILHSLLSKVGMSSNLTTDAHLAALALERGAELCSTDADFARFRGLRWTNPIEQR